MSNPYQSPTPVGPIVGVNSGRPEDLRSVAQLQKGIMYCILANIFLMVANLGLNAAIPVTPAAPPDAMRWLAALAILGLYLIVALIQLVLIVMLSIKVYNVAVGIVAGLFSFVPCLGLITLLIVNQKATKVLQANGIKVGLMGADLSQLPV